MAASALEKTFGFLSKANGEAAVALLRAGMDVPRPAVRRCALRALLRRRGSGAVQEVLRRLPGLTEADAPAVREHAQQFGRMMSEVLRSGPSAACETACRAVVTYRAYSAVPTLASGVNNLPEPRRGLFARTLLELAEGFYEELRELCSLQEREDREGQRTEIVEQLEQVVRKFHEHRRVEAVEAFYILATPKHAGLRQILGDNRGEIYRAIVAPLLESSRGGILRLALALLEDQWPLPPADEIVARREDLRFVELLLASVGTTRRWMTVRSTLRNVRSIAWAKPGHPLLTQLSGPQQRAAVSVMTATSMPRADLFAALEYLVVAGQPEGRVAAAQALAGYREPEADALFAAWLSHEDPAVRAIAVGQVRPRRGAEAVPLLLGMLDDRAPPVLAAIREALPEFGMARFLVRLKDMPPTVRNGVGRVVAKIAEDPVGDLRKDLDSELSHVRVRAAQAAGAMGLAGPLHEKLVALLTDDPDKFVRAACAEALAQLLHVQAQGESPAALGDPDGALLRAAAAEPAEAKATEEHEDAASAGEHSAVAVAELSEGPSAGLQNAPQEEPAEEYV